MPECSLIPPEIVLLDEVTSNLDASAENKVDRALENLLNGRTVIMVTHKVMGVKDADNIVVLENGSVKESGTFSELMNNDGLFRLMCLNQSKAGGEE